MDALPALIEPAPPLRVVASASLFRNASERRHLTVPPGATVLELAIDSGMVQLTGAVISPDGLVVESGTIELPPVGRLVIEINGTEVPQHMWHLVRPKPGRLVNIYLSPTNQRQAIIIGASLAIAIAAFYTGGLAAGAAGGAGTFGGSLAFAGASTAVTVGGACELAAFLPLGGAR